MNKRVTTPSGAKLPGTTIGPVPISVLLTRSGAVLLCALALGGCSTLRGWFDKADARAPTELGEIAPTVAISELWSVDAGAGEGELGVRQAPAIADGRVYAAAVEGGVHAYDLQTGEPIWHFESDLRLTGGPGVGDGLVVVGGLDGAVIALEAATGAKLWQAEVGNEVIAAPAIGMGKVFVRSNDGRVTAFDAATGERRWFWNHEVPLLALRGTAAPTLGPGLVFVGNDDGTVTALVAEDGRPLWEQTVAQAEGRTELQRMADVDGAPVLEGTTLFASSLKQQTVAINAPTGQPLWISERGGAGQVAVASEHVVLTDPAGIVYGLDKLTGSAMWSQPGLKYRKVTAPAIHGDYAVVGDYEGYLHWLDLDNGEFAARMQTGGEALRAAPVVADGILVAQSVEGELTAFGIAGNGE